MHWLAEQYNNCDFDPDTCIVSSPFTSLVSLGLKLFIGYVIFGICKSVYRNYIESTKINSSRLKDDMMIEKEDDVR